jgi:uncharacterized small protein (DUF1192 family)
MRAHGIAACVAAAVLSSGVVSALGAQTPTKKDTVAGKVPGAGGQLELAELTKQVQALRSRVSALESELAKKDNSAPKMAAKFQAPFTIVDENGKSIFTVGDDQYSAAFRGRVHIGPGTGNNYSVWFHDQSGTMVASMGEAKDGAGIIATLKGGRVTAEMDDLGFRTLNSTGKEIGHLGPNPAYPARGRLVVSGILALTDPAGNTLVDAGADGARGMVRAWPQENCRAFNGLKSPQCLEGAK